jgi:hypothetical protein
MIVRCALRQVLMEEKFSLIPCAEVFVEVFPRRFVRVEGAVVIEKDQVIWRMRVIHGGEGYSRGGDGSNGDEDNQTTLEISGRSITHTIRATREASGHFLP